MSSFFQKIRQEGTVANIAMLTVVTAFLGIGGISSLVSAIKGATTRSVLMTLWLLLLGVLLMSGAVFVGWYPLRRSVKARKNM
jgi:amino acid transporter